MSNAPPKFPAYAAESPVSTSSPGDFPSSANRNYNVRVQHSRVLGKGVDEFDINGVPRSIRLDSTPLLDSKSPCAPLALSDDDEEDQYFPTPLIKKSEYQNPSSSITATNPRIPDDLIVLPTDQYTPPVANQCSTATSRRVPPSLFGGGGGAGEVRVQSIPFSLPMPPTQPIPSPVGAGRRFSYMRAPGATGDELNPEHDFYRTATSAPLPSPYMSPNRRTSQSGDYYNQDFPLSEAGRSFEGQVANVGDGLFESSMSSQRRQSSQTNPSFASASSRGQSNKSPARENWKWFSKSGGAAAACRDNSDSATIHQQQRTDEDCCSTRTGIVLGSTYRHRQKGSAPTTRRNTTFIDGEENDQPAFHITEKKPSWSRVSVRSIPDDHHHQPQPSSDDDDEGVLGSALIPTRSQSVRGVSRRRLVLVIGGDTFEGGHIIRSLLLEGYAVRVWCKEGQTSTSVLHDYSSLVPSFNKNLFLLLDSNTRVALTDVEFVVFVSPLSGSLGQPSTSASNNNNRSSKDTPSRMCSSKIAAATGSSVSLSQFDGPTMVVPGSRKVGGVPPPSVSPSLSASSKARTFGQAAETDTQYQERILTKKMKEEVHELYVAISAHGRHVKRVIFMGSCTMPTEASKVLCRRSATFANSQSKSASMLRSNNLNLSFSHLHCNDMYEMPPAASPHLAYSAPQGDTGLLSTSQLRRSSSRVFQHSGMWFLRGVHAIATSLGPFVFGSCQVGSSSSPTRVTRRISQALDALHLDHTETSENGEMVVRARAAALVEARRTSAKMGIHTVFMLPSVMIGPPLTGSSSNAILKINNVVTGQCGLFSRVPKLHHNFVDVRDVGRWVCAALDSPNATPGKEYILSTGELSLSSVGRAVQPHFPSLSPIVSDLPNFFTLLFCTKWFSAQSTLGLLQRHVGFSCPIVGVNAPLDFCIPPTPLADTLIETTSALTSMAPQGYTPTLPTAYTPALAHSDDHGHQPPGITQGLLSFSAPATPNILGSSTTNLHFPNVPYASASATSIPNTTPLLNGAEGSVAGGGLSMSERQLFTVLPRGNSPLTMAQNGPLPSSSVSYMPPPELTTLPTPPTSESFFNVRTVLPILMAVLLGGATATTYGASKLKKMFS